jgi:hypothetical protein
VITRRDFLAAAASAGVLGTALRGAQAAGDRAAGGADSGTAAAPLASGDDRVLRIVQGPPGTPPAGAGADPLHWRLGAHEWLDPRRLQERLARWPGVHIEALVDGGNHLLLVDALRTQGGTLLRERFTPATQRWTVMARGAGAPRVS